MATVIRLQRHGRKSAPFYRIVVTDRRAPRDGRFIENIGTYNPMTNPATISLNFERALHWVNVGAQPSDTVRSILSKEGVLLMKHLQGGVKKGAFTEEEMAAKFEAWLKDKKAGVEASKSKIEAANRDAAKKALEAEREVNKTKAEALAAKKAEAEAAKKAAEEAAKAEAEGAEAEGAEATESASPAEETPAAEAEA